jgi:hypothetical protein
MATDNNRLTRHDLEAKIVKRCWEKEDFRREFTADPAGAFVRYLEVPAAGLPRIVIHEEPAGSWHIVLPSRPADIRELSERDLEQIAGGTSASCAAGAATSKLGPVSVAIVAATVGNVLSESLGASAFLTIEKGGW